MKINSPAKNKIPPLTQILLQLQLTLELSQLQEILSVYSELLLFFAEYTFLFETSPTGTSLSKSTSTPSGTSFSTQDPARDGGNWWSYCSNNPISFLDLNGLYQHQINDEYKMNTSGAEWYNQQIKGTKGNNNIIGKKGCAITIVANLLSDTTNYTPADINNKYVSNGDVNWTKVGNDNGYSVDIHENESFTRETLYTQMSDTNNIYKTVVKVKYNDGGDDHWVGVAGMTSMDGKDYLIITGSSLNDSCLGNGLSWNKETKKYEYTDTNNRQGKGWKVVNGQILVPVENTTKYINFTKPAPEGNEQNPSVGNNIKDF